MGRSRGCAERTEQGGRMKAFFDNVAGPGRGADAADYLVAGGDRGEYGCAGQTRL